MTKLPFIFPEFTAVSTSLTISYKISPELRNMGDCQILIVKNSKNKTYKFLSSLLSIYKPYVNENQKQKLNY